LVPDAAAAPAATEAPAAAPAASPAVATAASVTPPAAESPAPETTAPVGDGTRLFASPLVRRLAKERGIDLTVVQGSGPGGRIVRRDLDGLTAAPAARSTTASAPAERSAAGFTDVPHTGMRRA